MRICVFHLQFNKIHAFLFPYTFTINQWYTTHHTSIFHRPYTASLEHESSKLTHSPHNGEYTCSHRILYTHYTYVNIHIHVRSIIFTCCVALVRHAAFATRENIIISNIRYFISFADSFLSFSAVFEILFAVSLAFLQVAPILLMMSVTHLLLP